MYDAGPYVSTANPPLSDYIIQYNSQPQRTNHSFRMKAKSKCMGKHNANNRLSMRPIWQMSLAGIWKHFTSNRLDDCIIRYHFFSLQCSDFENWLLALQLLLDRANPEHLQRRSWSQSSWPEKTWHSWAVPVSIVGVTVESVQLGLTDQWNILIGILILTLAYLSMQYAVKYQVI